jgi:hypothetical protein
MSLGNAFALLDDENGTEDASVLAAAAVKAAKEVKKEAPKEEAKPAGWSS